MPTAVELTGVWEGDDGTIYYVRGLDDGSLTWAGLSNSGFHRGIEHTNVFKGRVSADGKTVTGHWADVPRGVTFGAGSLSLSIEVQGTPPRIMLAKNTAGTTGGFRTNQFFAGIAGTLGPHNAVQLIGETQRYDKPLGENNPPCRDFTVMWGTVKEVHTSSGPEWNRGVDNYCNFVQANDFSWGGDGDFDFVIEPDWDKNDPAFWTDGWLNQTFDDAGPTMSANDFMLYKYVSNHGLFQPEVPMFGRKNDQNHCGPDHPVVHTIPGWYEQGGWSVLVNGQPINGQLDESYIQGSSNPRLNHWTKFPATHPEVTLAPNDTIRVTGVVAQDTGHGGLGKPEIHPVYAFDVVQDFSKRHVAVGVVAGINLTGAWHCDDIGTYYIREIGNTVWWLGLSCDQGRQFANVYQGTISGNQIHGTWVDVPMGLHGVLGGGTLNIYCPEQSDSTELVRLSIPSPFTGATWTKLYDVTPPRLVELPPPPKPPVTAPIGPSKPGPAKPPAG
jgi:hypothetical protein